MRNKILSGYYQSLGLKYSKCLFPGHPCDNEAISAHSIQRSRVFDLLEKKNHLVTIDQIFDGDHLPRMVYKYVGQRQASTFLGLCPKHDAEMFIPIDQNPLLPTREQLFLLAYRSVLKELHASLERGYKFQSLYENKVNAGSITKDKPTTEGIIAAKYLTIAYETELYKRQFDEAWMMKQFDHVGHRIIELETIIPTVACSQLFSVDDIQFEDDCLRLILNVIPTAQDKTIVILSYTIKESRLANDFLLNKIEGNDYFSRYEISKLILSDCENFYLNPAYYEAWSDKKKKAILDYFEISLEGGDGDSEEYYLF